MAETSKGAVNTTTTNVGAERAAILTGRRRLTTSGRLEAESIHILREAVAELARPVMLYSIGKDIPR